MSRVKSLVAQSLNNVFYDFIYDLSPKVSQDVANIYRKITQNLYVTSKKKKKKPNTLLKPARSLTCLKLDLT